MKPKEDKTVGNLTDKEIKDLAEGATFEEIPIESVYNFVGQKVKFKANVLSVQTGTEKTQTGENQFKWDKAFTFFVEGTQRESNTRVMVKMVCTGNETEPSGIIEIYGIPQVIPKSKGAHHKISGLFVEAVKIAPADLAFKNYIPTQKEDQQIRQTFGVINNKNLEPIIDASIAPEIVGRAREKVALALTLFSPQRIPLFNNKQFLLTALAIGDSREAKDYIAEDVIFNLCPHGANTINAETARQTGLVGGIEKDATTQQYFIRWGKLVQSDGAIAHLKAISGYDGVAWRQLREILSSRVASIDKIISGRKEARCRLILTANCRKPIWQYPNKYRAFLDAGSGQNTLFEEEADALRIHLPIVYSRDDVPFALVNESASIKETKRAIPATVFKNKVADTWRRTLADFDVESIEKQLPYIKVSLAEWNKRYPNFSLAILGKEGIQVYTSLVMATATIKHRVNAEYQIVADLEDVRFVNRFLLELFENMGLEVEAKQFEGLKLLAHDLVKRIREEIAVETKEDQKINRNNALVFYLELIDLVYNRTVLTAETVEQLKQISRKTVFHKRFLAERTIEEDFGCKEQIISARTHKGMELTIFGVLVAKELAQTEGGLL